MSVPFVSVHDLLPLYSQKWKEKPANALGDRVPKESIEKYEQATINVNDPRILNEEREKKGRAAMKGSKAGSQLLPDRMTAEGWVKGHDDKGIYIDTVRIDTSTPGRSSRFMPGPDVFVSVPGCIDINALR